MIHFKSSVYVAREFKGLYIHIHDFGVHVKVPKLNRNKVNVLIFQGKIVFRGARNFFGEGNYNTLWRKSTYAFDAHGHGVR